jgi:hypothetical protein
MNLDIESVFVRSSPSNQNIIDIFEGEWSSTMPASADATSMPGHAALFSDPRIIWAHDVLGPFAGKNILELGPLEGAHTYMLEQFGAASITAIEANSRAFLKCLCIKEIFKMHRANFKLGSFEPFLENSGFYDVIVASGVLYHMTDPLRLLNLLMKRSDSLFIWTHYYDAGVLGEGSDIVKFSAPEPLSNTDYKGSKRVYPGVSLSWKGFSGGLESYAIWLERASLIGCLENGGFEVEVSFEQSDHPNGPALALCARRR